MADESKARILHQADVEDVIDHLVDADVDTDNIRDDAAYASRGVAVIASPTADAAALKVAVDEIRAALTASGVTG